MEVGIYAALWDFSVENDRFQDGSRILDRAALTYDFQNHMQNHKKNWFIMGMGSPPSEPN